MGLNVLFLLFISYWVYKTYSNVSVSELTQLGLHEYILLFFPIAIVVDCFNLVPMKVQDGNKSDGLIIKDLLKENKQKNKNA